MGETIMESEVIRRAQQGDENAFDHLVESYSSLVWSTAMALLGNRSLAEDVAQETWLDVWKALPTFQLERTFRAWLLVITANRCRKFTRRRAITVTSIDQDDEELREHLVSHQDMDAQMIRAE